MHTMHTTLLVAILAMHSTKYGYSRVLIAGMHTGGVYAYYAYSSSSMHNTRTCVVLLLGEYEYTCPDLFTLRLVGTTLLGYGHTLCSWQR